MRRISIMDFTLSFRSVSEADNRGAMGTKRESSMIPPEQPVHSFEQQHCNRNRACPVGSAMNG